MTVRLSHDREKRNDIWVAMDRVRAGLRRV